jgi:hypothetical protein
LINASFTIFDVSGKQLQASSSFNGNVITGLSKYPKGKYFITVTENKIISNYSFIKK